jgi:hypothetical protein
MRLACAAVVLMALASGCTGAAVSNQTAAPSPSVTAPEATQVPSQSAAVSTPVDGLWTLRQTKDDVRSHLKDHGFGDRADEFIQAEQIWDRDEWEWSFQDGSFRARWLTQDGVWKVADYGTFTADPKTVTLRFAEGDPGSTTTFRYTVAGDTLRLDWQGHQGTEDYKGFPDEAFWRAYLTSPLTRAS